MTISKAVYMFILIVFFIIFQSNFTQLLCFICTIIIYINAIKFCFSKFNRTIRFPIYYCVFVFRMNVYTFTIFATIQVF